jgi:hypothetical protein
MLVDAMNPTEIKQEVQNDWNAVRNSLDRLASEYDRERRKNKIDKRSVYSIAYPIKTKRKNTWIIFLSKAPGVNAYKGQQDINVLSVVYYYNSIGLRVLKLNEQDGLIVYNGHLFTRYKERMALIISNPIDVVKHFFINNGYASSKVTPIDGRDLTITKVKEGFLLGELQHERTWLVHKTFINKDLARVDQNEIEQGLIDSLKKQLEQEINNLEYDQHDFNYKTDVMKAISN